MNRRWKIFLPAMLILVSLVLTSVAARHFRQGSYSVTSTAALEIVMPVSRFLGYIGGSVEDIWQSYFNLVGLKAENEYLRRTVTRQTHQIVQLEEMRSVNDKLRNLLDFKERQPSKYLAAQVVAWDSGPWFRSIIISAGEMDGLELNYAVINEQGIVGRIVDLSPHYSKVLLVVDRSSGVDVFIQRNRVNGLLMGQGDFQMALNYVRKDEDVRLGDLVVSSGMDGIFPPGLAVGSVSLVDKMSLDMFMRAEISPSVNYSSLEEVLVVMGHQPALDWLSLAPNLKQIVEKKKGLLK